MKTSLRTVMLGAVLFGLSLSPSYSESATQDGPTITDGTGPVDTSEGDPGHDGNSGQDGGNGGNGGNITSVVAGSTNNDGIGALSAGGDGGNGGEGVDGETGGDGGNGGNGGNIDLTLTGESAGTVSAQSRGGDAGKAAMDVTSEATGGTGGNVRVTVAEGAYLLGSVLAGSTGGDSNDHLADGKSGDVTVTIAGTVSGDVYAVSMGEDAEAAGKVKVVLDGGVVNGTITASTKDTSSLTFKFNVADRAEYKAATLALTGSGAEGTVKINNQTYSWSGFSSLVDLLKYVGPEDKVVVSVTNDSTAVGDPASAPKAALKAEERPAAPRIVAGIEVIQGKPEMAKCSGGSEIRTVRLDNGSVVVIHHNRGADTLIGQLQGGEFRRASGAPDWTVRVGDGGKSVDVSDASGAALTSCAFS